MLAFHFELLVADEELHPDRFVRGIFRYAGQEVAGDVVVDFGLGSVQIMGSSGSHGRDWGMITGIYSLPWLVEAIREQPLRILTVVLALF